jgi:hypothetical protein
MVRATDAHKHEDKQERERAHNEPYNGIVGSARRLCQDPARALSKSILPKSLRPMAPEFDIAQLDHRETKGTHVQQGALLREQLSSLCWHKLQNRWAIVALR